MSEPQLTYKKKKKAEIRKEIYEALEEHVAPVPKVADLPEISPRRGVEKKVVRGFLEDPRTLNLRKNILDGLTPKEAGMLAGFAPEELDSLQKRSDEYRRFVQNTLIEFKHNHLSRISQKADPKMSQWLLERMFPDEFVASRRNTDDDSGRSATTVIQAIVKTVQSRNDSPVPVDFTYANGYSTEEESHNGEPKDNPRLESSSDGGGANIIQ